jgi:hypothetical protein
MQQWIRRFGRKQRFVRKLSKVEGTVTTGWLVAYLVCGFGPSLSVIFVPGVYALFGCQVASQPRKLPTTRGILFISPLVAGIAVWCYLMGKTELAILLGTISVGSGIGVLASKRTSRRANYPGTLWLVLVATLHLTADVLSRKSMLGTQTTIAVIIMGILSVASGIWWLRVRETTKELALSRATRE